jgi:hypothetical protein
MSTGPASALHEVGDKVGDGGDDLGPTDLDPCHPPEGVEPPECVAEPAFWRVKSQSWIEGWNAGQVFRDVMFVTPLRGFALLDGFDTTPSLLETVDGGETWHVAYRGHSTANAAVDFVDPSNGVAVNLSPKTGVDFRVGIALTKSGGRQWDDVHAQPGLRDVTYMAGGTGIVAVGGTGTVLRSETGGSEGSWELGTDMSDAKLPANLTLNSVGFALGAANANAAEGLAVGRTGSATSPTGKIFRTADGGQHWSEVHSVPGVELLEVAMARDGDATLSVAVGTQGTILYRVDEGAWTRAAIPFPTADARLPSINGIALSVTTGEGGETVFAGYAVGGNQTVLEMHGDPAVWVPAPVDPRALRFGPTSTLEAVALVPAHDGQRAVAVGGLNTNQSATGRLGVMLERTPATDDPEGFADMLADEKWWQCSPKDPTGAPEVNGVVGEALPVCDAQEDRTTSPSRGAVGAPTDAVACQLDEEQLDDKGTQAADFPCLRTWVPRDEEAKVIDAPDALFLDDDIGGEGRRVVGVSRTHVFLFDPDRFEQRGAQGFGAGWKGNSGAFGATAGVLAFGDLPLPPGVDPEAWPPENLGFHPRLRAYDEERDRVYLATSNVKNEGGDAGGDPKILAVSVTGEFLPTVISIPALVNPDAPGRSAPVIVYLGADARHGMLYALTETNLRRDVVGGATSQSFSDTVQVALHAFSSEVEDGELKLMPAWILPLESGCNVARNENLSYFGVSLSGDSIAFACAGYAGYYYGNPSIGPNSIATINLSLRGRHPRHLEALNSADVSVDFEPIAGNVYGTPKTSFGAEARAVLAWNQKEDGAALWDYQVGGWIGSLPFSNLVAAGSFGIDDEHPWRGRLYFTCGWGVSHAQRDGCVDWNLKDDDAVADDPALLVVDSLNVPSQVPASLTKAVKLPDSGGNPEPGVDAQLLAIPPLREGQRPLLFLRGTPANAVHIFEDRVAPVLVQTRPDPDLATNDVPEAEAAAVTRVGRASGYGARVWSTGLGTASTPACQFPAGRWSSPTNNCGRSTLSYEWLMDRDSAAGGGELVGFGAHTSALSGAPGADQRELRLGSVQQAALENELAQAQATALYYDGGPAADEAGTTGEDIGRRRGRDPHRFADAEVGTFTKEFESRECPPPPPPPTSTSSSTTTTTAPCRTKYDDFREAHHGTPDDPDTEENENEENPGLFDGQFGPYEAQFDEFVDRTQREVDGERRVQGQCDEPATDDRAEDCFEDFDEMDPRSDRRSLEERAELTYPSACLEPAGKDEPSAGSQTVCEVDEFGRTEARAELGPFALLPEDASGAVEGLSIGATGSDTDIFRDPKDGMVVETTAWAADVELSVGGVTLRIGEVRSTARAQAKGVKGSAMSRLSVSFDEVVITGPDGPERFACGRAHPESGPPSLDASNPPTRDDPATEENESDFDRNGDGSEDEKDAVHAAGLTPDPAYAEPGENHSPVACDPHQVADAISAAFAGKVRATTSAPDTDEKVTGSPMGAQAMVRRDPVAALSDFVINRIERHFDLPALQLTIFNDGLQANRMQVDLAAVYAETHYEIGKRRIEGAPEPGAIEVSLVDPFDEPIEGGEFTLYGDDGDGQLGGTDAALAECVTDATGTCGFEHLDSGDYLVAQRLAPPGFLAQKGAVPVFVAEGATESVDFVNGPDSAAVEVVLVDHRGNPLGGGEFALVGAQGAVEPTDKVSVACATGPDGRCGFSRLPVGSYVLHQGKAPNGFMVADDVAFTLARPGQIAEIKVVNGLAVAGRTVRIIELIDGIPASSRGHGDGDGGDDDGWWGLVPKALAGIALRGWGQALLFALTAMLFGAPGYLAHRRRELAMARGRGT